MLWIREHLILLLLLAGYTGLMIRHAWDGQQRSRAPVDYFVGGRSISGWAIAISFFATYSCSNTFLGFSGKS